MKKTICTKQYYENFAINTLKKYFPEKFSKFKKHECPDWLCGNIGLEVTRSISTQDGELDAFINDCQGKEFSAINKQRLRKLGFQTTLTKSNKEYIYETRSRKNGVISFLHTKDNRYIFLFYFSRVDLVENRINDIDAAIEEKLKKLNSNYDKFEENDLAIIVQEQLNYEIGDRTIVNDIAERIIAFIKSLYSDSKYTIVFDYIYVIFMDNIFIIDAASLSCKRILISSEDIYALSKESSE